MRKYLLCLTQNYLVSSPSLGVRVRVHRDMPPAGGFESVKYKRNLPVRGPGALAILGGVTAVCAYGFYRLGKGNLEKRQVVIVSSISISLPPFSISLCVVPLSSFAPSSRFILLAQSSLGFSGGYVSYTCGREFVSK